MSNMFHSVASSLEQQTSGSQQPVDPGRIIVNGPPGGPVRSIFFLILSFYVLNQPLHEKNV